MSDDLACDHCPDGHSDPTGRPWAAFVADERDGDGQPTHLYVAPTAGQHVAESDAEWVRRRLNPQPPTDAAALLRGEIAVAEADAALYWRLGRSADATMANARCRAFERALHIVEHAEAVR
jgi:hypothetical protein